MNTTAPHDKCITGITGTGSKLTQWATICIVMFTTLLLGVVMIGGVMEPKEAYAGYNELSGPKPSCITNGCHSTASKTGTLTTAINRTPATEVTVAPGDDIEVDWMFSIRGNTGEFSSAPMLTTPTGWTVASGTTNTPALAGWSSTWDLANGVGWNTNATLNCSVAGAACFAIDYANSLWDSGSYDVACDNGSVCSQGSDLDGIQNHMGADARITIPSNAATSATPYSVNVYAIGHDTKKKSLNTKTNKLQSVSVLVQPPGTTVVGDGIAPANKTVYGYDMHRTVSTFTLSANAVDTVTHILVTGTGTGLAYVAAAELWKDTGSIPNEWDSGDTPIGTEQPFSAGVATFSGLSESVSNIPVKYLVTYDIIAAPVAGTTMLGTVTGLIATNTVQSYDLTSATLTVAAATAPFTSIVTTGNWNSAASWDQNSVPTAGSKVIISAGNTITTDVSTQSLGELTVNGTLNIGAFSITVNGPTMINGTLAHNSATGIKTYSGLVTINPGGRWSNSAHAAITLGGGLTNNSSNAFTSGSGTYTFSTNSQTIGGTNSTTIQNVTVAGVTLTNTGTLTVGGALTGTGGVTNAGTLNIGGTAGITTLESTDPASTVNFNAAGAQTVVAGLYNNLTLSGSGAKALQSGIFTIGGNLIVGGTTSTVSVEDTLINGNLVVGDGASFTAAGFALNVNGTTTIGGGINGRLTIASATGAKSFTGLVTLNSGAIWDNSSANSPVSFSGGIHNNGIFNAGTGVYTFGAAAQSVSGTLSIPNVTVTGVTLTNNGALTVGTALSGSGTLAQAANSSLTIGGISGIAKLVANATGNSVNYSGTAQTIHTIAYHNLTLSGSGNKAMGSGTSVTGILSIAPTGTAKALIGTGLNIDVAGTLTLAGINRSPGTWGSSSSPATNKNDTYFAASTGIVTLQGAPPAITSAASTSFTYGTASIFTVVSVATPPATITKTGSLPVGVSFKDNGDGTATIGGTPNSSGAFPLNISAVNNYGSATQAFALTVTPRDTNTTSAVDTEISVSPNRHLFGTVSNIPACGPPATFTVRNAGSTPRTLGTLTLGGYDAAQYSIGAGTCSGSTLSTGQTCTVGVSFCPTSTGSRSSYLQIPSNDPETPVLTAMLYNHESLDEEAARRLPPVLQNLDIPSSCLAAGQPCTISWSLLGYDEDYLSRTVLFSCTGITNGTCGDSSAGIIRDSGTVGAVSSTTGVWSYTHGDTVYSKKFDYSYTFTTPAAGPVVIRFYRKTLDDDAAGLGGLSLLIPGNQNQSGTSYYDNQGRRIQYTIAP